MTFVETRLDLGYDFGTVGSPEFNTTITVLGSGYEQRNSNWSDARRKYQIGDRIYDKEELNYILNFFHAMRGAAIGFRFKDWSDWRGTNELVGVGNGVLQTFQLRKMYSVDNQFSERHIKKPVAGTVTLAVAGSPQISGWSIDNTTGIISFNSPPVGNITASFQFDVPCRFEQDSFDHRFDAADPDSGDALFYVSTLSVIEVRL